MSLQKGQTRWQGQKLIDFILQCVWKTKFLGTSSEGLFLDSFWQNLLPHPHCQEILQSTPYQIWDFLLSCWGCLLTLWLEICVPNNKFGFSGDNCYIKLPAKFCLRDVALKTCQKRWMIVRSGERESGISVLAAQHDDDDYLQISSDAKYFSSLVQGIVIKD